MQRSAANMLRLWRRSVPRAPTAILQVPRSYSTVPPAPTPQSKAPPVTFDRKRLRELGLRYFLWSALLTMSLNLYWQRTRLTELEERGPATTHLLETRRAELEKMLNKLEQTDAITETMKKEAKELLVRPITKVNIDDEQDEHKEHTATAATTAVTTPKEPAAQSTPSEQQTDAKSDADAPKKKRIIF
ncbi:hypothetical protein GQ42DRAFT_66978 [Ramicandelaber brevisporus]|nr:hypothetical protein GQ42DRAFT_66978 [Ramicandelaber brevisporus]